MIQKSICAFSMSLLVSPWLSAQDSAATHSANSTNNKEVARPFSAAEVKLLPGPFKHAQDLDAAWLLSLDPDRLLSWYRKEANLEPRGKVYGGWESQGVAGHSLGHYLSACARMAHATGQQEFERRVNFIVDEVAKCQQAGGDGYVGAIPDGRKIFKEVSRGDIRSQGFDLNGSWVPWYTLHKEFAGLIDAYRYCDNELAKEIAVRLADWVEETTKNLTDEQWQTMLACEHGGMNESLADVYVITGDPRYLTLAKKFYHQAILDPLADGVDILPGKHSNTQIPKIIGAAKIGVLTGDPKFTKIANFFWDTMTGGHTYVNGGNSLSEHLGQAGKLNDRLGPKTAESCNTYNMLKLTSALCAQDPQPRYADYAERALWNHILASQNSENGRVCYFLPLQAGAQKPFMDPEAFTCCSGSGMENHARYNEYIYSHSTDALWVSQFISSEVKWRDKGVQVRQDAEQLLQEGIVRLEITCDSPQKFSMFIRRPAWAAEGFHILVNGEAVAVDSDPSSYVELKRNWKTGDEVLVEMPLSLRTEAMPDNPNRIAVFYGPVLLVGDLEDDPQKMLPVLVTNDRPVADWLKRSPGDELKFVTQNAGHPREQELVPFYAITQERYIVYWDQFTGSDWHKREEAYEAELARQEELATRSIDWIALGEMQSERDHEVKGKNTDVGDFSGRKYRHAWQGGWFSCKVDIPHDQPADLVVTYWGSETGSRTFDILLDGEKLATESLHQDKPEEFWDKTYPLPQRLTSGKSEAVLRFQAHPKNMAGGAFGVRIVKRKQP